MNVLTTRTPSVIAEEINVIKGQTRSMILHSSIEIGRRLVEAKALVAHGEWGNYLKEHVDYSQSTANNLMQISREYGASSNLQALGDLSYTKAIALLGVPVEERETFVKDNNVEDMSSRELQLVIQEKKKLEKQLKQREEEIEKERKERKLVSDQLTELEKKNKKHAALVERLQEEIEAAKEFGNHAEVENLQSLLNEKQRELSQSHEQVKQLEAQLKEKPIEVSAVIEKIPVDVEKELATLREQVKRQSNPATIKFQYSFDFLVDGFKDLLENLEEVKEVDVDLYEKYKNAVSGLIGKMSEKL